MRRAGLVLALAALASPASAAVGRIEAAYGVGVSGAPQYTIPIELTEGVAGLTPRLAITATGASTRGVLGVGFDLAGLSAITPCAKTIAQDGAASPVVISSGDRYCLDGQRLRLVSGTHGASGAIYRTELDTVARITAKDSASGIPGRFTVEQPDGLI